MSTESSRAAPRSRRAAAWIAMPLVALVLASVLDAVDLAAPDPRGGTAARYLPVEGQRTVSLGVDGVETVVEHARAVGVEELLAAPPAVAAELLAALGDDGAPRAQWWRSSRVDDAGRRSTALHLVDAQGVALAATWGGALGLVFVPPLPVLPAEVAPGESWRASGSALAGGAIAYEASFSAWRPDGAFADTLGRDLPLTGGCIGVDAELALTEPGGDFARRLVESTLWCPGRGAVWSRADLDGAPVGFAEVRPAALDPQRREAEPASGPAPGPLGWGEGGMLDRAVDDPFFGPAPANGQYAVAPASTADGRLVTANDRGDDVEVWRLEGATATREWAGHPGGTIVAVGVVGDLVVATTAQRRVVAYDAVGRRLWSRALDELVLGAPVALATPGAGAPDVVVATRGGDVVRLSAATGEVVWSRSIGADARRGPVVAEGLVLVADERERLTALDGASGAARWRAELGLVDALAASADAVVVLVDARTLAVVGLTDGTVLAEHPLAGLARGLVAADGRALGLTEEGLLAVPLDVRASEVEQRRAALWSAPGGEALALVGDAVVVVRGTSVDLLDVETGRRVDGVAAEPASIGAGRAALVVGGAMALVDSDGALQRWSLRQGSAR